MHVHAHIHIYIYTYVHIAHTYICIYIYMHVHIHILIYIYTYACISIYIYMYICIDRRPRDMFWPTSRLPPPGRFHASALAQRLSGAWLRVPMPCEPTIMPQGSKAASTWTPKVCKTMALWALSRGFGFWASIGIRLVTVHVLFRARSVHRAFRDRFGTHPGRSSSEPTCQPAPGGLISLVPLQQDALPSPKAV